MWTSRRESLWSDSRKGHTASMRTAEASFSRCRAPTPRMCTNSGRQKYIVLQTPEEDLSEKYRRVLQDGFISMDMAQNILVIKTVPGMAMAVAASLDAMKWHEVVGCIAGDDTIMCAVRSVEETTEVMENISRIVFK